MPPTAAPPKAPMPAPFSRVVRLPPEQPTSELISKTANMLFTVLVIAPSWELGNEKL
jgi:hypothetical protein